MAVSVLQYRTESTGFWQTFGHKNKERGYSGSNSAFYTGLDSSLHGGKQPWTLMGGRTSE